MKRPFPALAALVFARPASAREAGRVGMDSLRALGQPVGGGALLFMVIVN